jgi:riboflavin biosynthesis pyrimidine reductase
MTRPTVLAHNVASLDGRLTIAPRVLLLTGDERWSAIAGATDGYSRLMREYAPDAILEGSGSFVMDAETWTTGADPAAGGMAQPGEDFLPSSVTGRPGHRGWFTVVDGRGRVRWGFKEYPDPSWAGWHLLVLVCARTPAAYVAYLREEKIPYLVAGDGRVDLALALEKLGDKLRVRRVLSTAGGRLGGALLRAGLIDEIDLELLPALIGGDATPALFDARPLAPDEQPSRIQVTDLGLRHGHITVRARVVGVRDADASSSGRRRQPGRCRAPRARRS